MRAEPYRISLSSGESREILLHLRNFRPGKQKHHIEIHPPPGLIVEPPVWKGKLAGESRRSLAFRLRAEPSLKPGVQIVAIDVTLDGHRYGERFDLVVGLNCSPSPGSSGAGCAWDGGGRR